MTLRTHRPPASDRWRRLAACCIAGWQPAGFRAPADCQSATQQVANLCYGASSRTHSVTHDVTRGSITHHASRILAAPKRSAGGTHHASAFTLAEVLAALMFLAIVIPTAVEALHVASLAGEVAARKSEAARIADRVLNENLVTTNWSGGVQNGTISEGVLDFQWKLSSQTWPQDSMELLTADVSYTAQGKNYSVELSTLANLQTTTPPSGTGQVVQQ